jgi:hypothetical protein
VLGVGQERLGPSYFFISLVLGPLNSLAWYVPSLRYTRGLGWRMMMMSFICSCRNKNQPKAIYPKGTSHHTSLLRGPSTNDKYPWGIWDRALGAIEDNISQCTFLQMTYTAENPHADGSAAPGARPRFRPPRRRDPHATSPAPTATGRREDRCPVVSKRPLHSRAAAKMSPHIRIGPEPVLTAHAPSPPAAGSHCPPKEDSAPHCGTEFFPCGVEVTESSTNKQHHHHQNPLHATDFFNAIDEQI